MTCHFTDLVCEDEQEAFSESDIAQLAEHIKTNGNLFPFEVTLVDSKYVVPRRQVHRYEAIKRLGEEYWSNIPIRVSYT